MSIRFHEPKTGQDQRTEVLSKNRSPRARLFIAGIVLALTGAVVGGITVLNNSHGIQNRNSGLLADLGLTSISLQEAIQQSKDHNVELYWVGGLDTDRYATEVLSNQVRDFHYLAGDSSDVTSSSSLLRVATYPANTELSQLARGPLHTSPDITTTNGRGDVIVYNPTDPRSIIVKLATDYSDTKTSQEPSEAVSEEIVTLEFASDKTLAYLIRMSERVVPLY